MAEVHEISDAILVRLRGSESGVAVHGLDNNENSACVSDEGAVTVRVALGRVA